MCVCANDYRCVREIMRRCVPLCVCGGDIFFFLHTHRSPVAPELKFIVAISTRQHIIVFVVVVVPVQSEKSGGFFYTLISNFAEIGTEEEEAVNRRTRGKCEPWKSGSCSGVRASESRSRSEECANFYFPLSETIAMTIARRRRIIDSIVCRGVANNSVV